MELTFEKWLKAFPVRIADQDIRQEVLISRWRAWKRHQQTEAGLHRKMVRDYERWAKLNYWRKMPVLSPLTQEPASPQPPDLRLLSHDEKRVIETYFWGKISLPDVGEALGMTLYRVRQCLTNGVNQLRLLLEEK